MKTTVCAFASAVLLSCAAPLTIASANAASISGTWAGTGTVKLEAGSSEIVRCQVTYNRISGQNFSLSARCATSSTRIDQAGELTRVSNGRYVGSVHNQQYNVSAKVKIKVSGNRQVVRISSGKGSANLTLRRR